MRKTKHLKKRKNKTFKGGSNQSEKQLQINNQRLQNENAFLRNQFLETKQALQSLKQKMRLRDSQDLNNLNAKYEEKISQFNQLTGENKRLKSKMTDLESQLNNIIRENKTINLDHEKLKGQHESLISQHETLNTENSNNMQSLTTLLNEKDRKIFHLWKIVCNYLNYTNSLHEELNKDISIQNDITNNLNNRIANKRNFDEWWDRSVKNKIPLCDANMNLETWLNSGNSNNIMY